MSETKQTASVQPTEAESAMRSIDATAGYMSAGAMALANPGVGSKVAGSVLIAKGVQEQWRAMGHEDASSLQLMGMRERVLSFARSMVDKNTGKTNFVARLKRNVGENILSFEDRQYRNSFDRMMGGMAMAMAGVEFLQQPGLAPKIAGVVVGNVGVLEQVRNTVRTSERHNQLHTAAKS